MKKLERAQTLHQAAMELAEEAYLAQLKEERSSAIEIHRRAFMLESEAADALADSIDLEPTRSILYRSAATLAVRCGDLNSAKRLADLGLSGNPPAEIADELREVLADIGRRLPRESNVRDSLSNSRGERMSEELFFNGVTPKGQYVTQPIGADELLKRVSRMGLNTPPEWVLDGVRERPKGDPKRRPIDDVERKWDLAEAGWAVVFAPGLDRRVRGALDELLSLRESQATSRGRSQYFRSLDYREGEETLDFLQRNGATAGSRGDPDFLPYYILLVGEPERLPYRFQQELDVGYAVGRICFDRPEDYASYAQSVVRAETRRPARPRQVGFFGTAHENDPATQSMAKELVVPLSESVVEPGTGWEARRAIGPDARKDRLRKLLGGPETPALLLAACHGLGISDEDERQREAQGALVCQDWPGPNDEEGVDEDQWFAASDIPEDATLEGLVAFFVACYGVGTPSRDNFDQDAAGKPRQIAPKDFVSRLPQRLLSHPRGGALAVVGHVDRAWTSSFAGSEKGEGRGPYLYALKRLLQGHTVGWAFEGLNLMYASLAVQLGNLWESQQRREKEIDANLFSYLWRLRNDARNYTVFGDPAVRLPGAGEPR